MKYRIFKSRIASVTLYWWAPPPHWTGAKLLHFMTAQTGETMCAKECRRDNNIVHFVEHHIQSVHSA